MGIQPTGDVSGGLVFEEAMIEFLADLEWEPGDFTVFWRSSGAAKVRKDL
jgi:hypothetical protein